MKPTTKKRFQKAIKIIVVVLMVISVLIAILINFILTPQRLTPLALSLANQYLTAKVELERVELTYFSTFPYFGVRLTNGQIISHVDADTIPARQDSLLSFSKCVVTVNPLDYLVNNRISVRRIVLINASGYAYKNTAGATNWDIVKAGSDTLVADTDTIRKPFKTEIDVKKIVIKRASFVFDDRSTEIYSAISDLNLQLSMALTKEKAFLNLNFDTGNILFWQQGELLANKIAIAMQTDMERETESRLWHLRNTDLTVNGILFDADGTFQYNRESHRFGVDFNYMLHVPTLKAALDLIPETVFQKKDLTAQGKLEVSGAIRGEYGQGSMPVMTMCIQVEDGSAQYVGMPYGIDKLSADFDAYIDLMRQTPSYADLKIFHFQGAHTDILADARIDDLLDDPLITLNTTSTVDLDALYQAFPWQDSIDIGGKLVADLRAKCRLSTLQKQDFGRIAIQGKLQMDQLMVVDSIHDLRFLSDATLSFDGDKTLQAQAEINNLEILNPNYSAVVENLSAEVKSTNPIDTTRVIDLTGKIMLNHFKATQVVDSSQVYCGKSEITIQISPEKKNPRMPQASFSMHSDSISLAMGDNNMQLDAADLTLKAHRANDSIWVPKGSVGFNKFCIHASAFKLPICVNKTLVSVDSTDIILNNASIQVGESDITATGSVHNLLESLNNSEKLIAKLDIVSDRINCEEIIRALAFEEDTLQSTADSIATPLFVIPANIDFTLNTNIKKVTFDKMPFENVKGRIEVRDQYLYLENLSMRALDADMKTILAYKTFGNRAAYLGADFRIHDINVGKLVQFIPALDSIVPMLRSFKGRVDFDVSAETRLDSTMNIKLPTLKAAVHIKGDSLVLMDGETFAEISKMLMFKNKKENVFDSVSVNITINDGNVLVYPFLVEIDRYRAAIGGEQGLDMNFKYHISILKSPLPFKAGVNITGNLDKMKFGIGKAKYKNAVSPANILRVDSTRLQMGQTIVDNFRKVIRKERGEPKPMPQNLNLEEIDSISMGKEDVAIDSLQTMIQDSILTISDSVTVKK